MTTTPEKIIYTAVATTVGGRRGGHARTSDGLLEVDLNAPKELGGPGTGTNPEQLFAAGYSACFNSALVAVAKQAGIKADDAHVTAKVGFGPAGQGYALTVDLEVSLAGFDLAQVQELADKAHQVCPYSNAVRGNVPTTVTAIAA